MNTTRSIYHLALADFYERTRRFSFLLILAAAIFMGLLVNNGTLFLSLGPINRTPLSASYRGEFNSAWIGAMTVLVTNAFLGLLGFFLVSDCIKRDIRTGVGQIIATAPISRATYLIGKWISNVLVLFALVLVQAVAALVMALLKNEAALDLSALLLPFLAVALPYMALIAAVAVVFETVPWLRGTVGNAVYFFLWMSLFLASVNGELALPLVKDPLGVDVFRASLYDAANATFHDEPIGAMGISGFTDMPFKVFNWPGLAWTPGIIFGRWVWVAFSLGLILLSALWFTRFDPSREGLRRGRVKSEKSKGCVPAARHIKALRIALPNLSPLISKLAGANIFLGVLFAELRLLLNRRQWWWWLGIVGLNIAILCTPPSIAKGYLLPVALLWPLPIWSELGNREKKNNTHQMVFSCAQPVLRQLPAAWLAGVLVTALFGISGAMFFMVHHDLPGLVGWVGAVLFIPSLALGLGVFSSSNRLFEVIYLMWWYMGPYQKLPALNFISGAAQTYLLLAAGLLLFSTFWRARQVRV